MGIVVFLKGREVGVPVQHASRARVANNVSSADGEIPYVSLVLYAGESQEQGVTGQETEVARFNLASVDGWTLVEY